MSKLHIKAFFKTARTDYERECINDILIPGFLINGDDASISYKDYEACDVALILYSPRSGPSSSTRSSRFVRNNHGPNLLIFEMPIFRETQTWYSRFGFDHVHRAGRFAPTECPMDRFEKLKLPLLPWREGGDSVVIAGQVNGDYSVDGIDVFEWACDVAMHLKRTTPWNIVVRPHPADTENNWNEFGRMQGIRISRESLQYDLDRAKCWVSYTSGSSIDAIMAGVPSIALSPNNFCWEVSRHSVNDVDNPLLADRGPVLSSLAYSQWSQEEIYSGEAWKHLRDFVLTR